MRSLWVYLLLAGTMGCGLATPSSGEVDELNGQTIGHARFDLRVRHTDLLPVDVFFPANDDGTLRGEGHDGVVYIQGGNVRASDYHWFARELASRGFVVAEPDIASRLAIASIDDGVFAQKLLLDPPAGSLLERAVDPDRIALAGHSLGGVVAAKVALKVHAAALLFHASYSDTVDDAELKQAAIPTAIVAGRNDCSAKLDAVQEGFGRLTSPAILTVLDGVTHYQFTASEQTDVDRGCHADVPLEAAHVRIVDASAGFLKDALSDSHGRGEEAQRAVPGAEVTVK